MTDAQLVTTILTSALAPFLAAMITVLVNNHRLNDMGSRLDSLRDMLRAEMRADKVEIMARLDRIENALLTRMADLDTRLSRFESRS